ncbi:MAG: Domain of unknown function / ABC transporter, permease protein 2 (cluster 5, nickel/peptides/opines), partial [uncultured Thermomicrobiales bacterium]
GDHAFRVGPRPGYPADRIRPAPGRRPRARRPAGARRRPRRSGSERGRDRGDGRGGKRWRLPPPRRPSPPRRRRRRQGGRRPLRGDGRPLRLGLRHLPARLRHRPLEQPRRLGRQPKERPPRLDHPARRRGRGGARRLLPRRADRDPRYPRRRGPHLPLPDRLSPRARPDGPLPDPQRRHLPRSPARHPGDPGPPRWHRGSPRQRSGSRPPRRGGRPFPARLRRPGARSPLGRPGGRPGHRARLRRALPRPRPPPEPRRRAPRRPLRPARRRRLWTGRSPPRRLRRPHPGRRRRPSRRTGRGLGRSRRHRLWRDGDRWPRPRHLGRPPLRLPGWPPDRDPDRRRLDPDRRHPRHRRRLPRRRRRRRHPARRRRRLERTDPAALDLPRLRPRPPPLADHDRPRTLLLARPHDPGPLDGPPDPLRPTGRGCPRPRRLPAADHAPPCLSSDRALHRRPNDLLRPRRDPGRGIALVPWPWRPQHPDLGSDAGGRLPHRRPLRRLLVVGSPPRHPDRSHRPRLHAPRPGDGAGLRPPTAEDGV